VSVYNLLVGFENAFFLQKFLANKVPELLLLSNKQVTDLRSQIVRVACAAVVVFSQELGAWFNMTFEQYMLPALLKQLPVKALPIRDSAHDCIQMVLSHRTNVKLLRLFFNARSGNASTR
jgi:hypothetical protein